jgi:hypothetical protein
VEGQPARPGFLAVAVTRVPVSPGVQASDVMRGGAS